MASEARSRSPQDGARRRREYSRFTVLTTSIKYHTKHIISLNLLIPTIVRLAQDQFLIVFYFYISVD